MTSTWNTYRHSPEAQETSSLAEGLMRQRICQYLTRLRLPQGGSEVNFAVVGQEIRALLDAIDDQLPLPELHTQVAEAFEAIYWPDLQSEIVNIGRNLTFLAEKLVINGVNIDRFLDAIGAMAAVNEAARQARDLGNLPSTLLYLGILTVGAVQTGNEMRRFLNSTGAGATLEREILDTLGNMIKFLHENVQGWGRRDEILWNRRLVLHRRYWQRPRETHFLQQRERRLTHLQLIRDASDRSVSLTPGSTAFNTELNVKPLGWDDFSNQTDKIKILVSQIPLHARNQARPPESAIQRAGMRNEAGASPEAEQLGLRLPEVRDRDGPRYFGSRSQAQNDLHEELNATTPANLLLLNHRNNTQESRAATAGRTSSSPRDGTHQDAAARAAPSVARDHYSRNATQHMEELQLISGAFSDHESDEALVETVGNGVQSLTREPLTEGFQSLLRSYERMPRTGATIDNTPSVLYDLQTQFFDLAVHPDAQLRRPGNMDIETIRREELHRIFRNPILEDRGSRRNPSRRLRLRRRRPAQSDVFRPNRLTNPEVATAQQNALNQQTAMVLDAGIAVATNLASGNSTESAQMVNQDSPFAAEARSMMLEHNMRTQYMTVARTNALEFVMRASDIQRRQAAARRSADQVIASQPQQAIGTAVEAGVDAAEDASDPTLGYLFENTRALPYTRWPSLPRAFLDRVPRWFCQSMIDRLEVLTMADIRHGTNLSQIGYQFAHIFASQPDATAEDREVWALLNDQSAVDIRSAVQILLASSLDLSHISFLFREPTNIEAPIEDVVATMDSLAPELVASLIRRSAPAVAVDQADDAEDAADIVDQGWEGSEFE